MNWIDLVAEAQLSDLVALSHTQPVVIFKHSTRCSISVAAKSRLERSWDFQADEIAAFYLDLLNYRDISNKIAADFSVYHESPQLLLIQKGECTYAESHSAIRVDDLREQLHLNSI
jgi:bacillithiol system protein YtxJ